MESEFRGVGQIISLMGLNRRRDKAIRGKCQAWPYTHARTLPAKCQSRGGAVRENMIMYLIIFFLGGGGGGGSLIEHFNGVASKIGK